MPVNSFTDYPMSWKPRREEIGFPIYISLANLLERDIGHGLLPPGTQLPPQRELADYLDLNFSTITRVYKLCEQKGLIHAVIGRGTFVSPNANIMSTVVCKTANPQIDLGTINGFYTHNKLVRDIAIDVMKSPFSEKLLEYTHPLGMPHHRQICATWLKRFEVETDWQSILMTAGSQNSLAIILTALFSPGDKIAVDVYTYPNFISLANMLHIQLIAVQGDDEGMLPEMLDRACRSTTISGVYLMPSCSNPTNTGISEARRKELAMIMKAHGLLIIEDEAYSCLMSTRMMPFFHFLPEQSVFVCGISKPLATGLRVGCIAAPVSLLPRLELGVYGIDIKAPSLNAEIATALISNGLCETIIREKREMMLLRNKLFSQYFPSISVNYESLSQWLQLPDGCSGRSFEIQANTQGVRVFGAQRFSVGMDSRDNAVRIATSTPVSLEELEDGLRILKNIPENQSEVPALVV